MEGVLTFKASVDLESVTAPTETASREQITKQLRYLIGNLQYEAEGFHGTPSLGFQLTNLKIAAGASAGFYRITYDYRSNVAVANGTVNGLVKFDLPRNPDLIVQQSGDACSSNMAEPLWYAFTPHKSGCRLTSGQDYDIYSGQLVLGPTMVTSFPEYEKLMSAEKVVRMAVLMNFEIEHADPYIKDLVIQGFSPRLWTQGEISALLGFTPKVFPQVEDFTKSGPNGTLKILLFYGNARVEDLDGSRAFHYFYKNALETSNVVVYNGHSGLGSNIDLGLIEKSEGFQVRLNPDYQLYFFSGCITYSYYVDMYLARKATPADPRGTKLFDVLTFGQELPGFDKRPLATVTAAVKEFALNGKKASYQAITNQIRYSWFAVVGDEDNPTQP